MCVCGGGSRLFIEIISGQNWLNFHDRSWEDINRLDEHMQETYMYCIS